MHRKLSIQPHSRKKAGSRDPGSHDFLGKIRKNRKKSEKYCEGEVFQKNWKNTRKKKFGKIRNFFLGKYEINSENFLKKVWKNRKFF